MVTDLRTRPDVVPLDAEIPPAELPAAPPPSESVPRPPSKWWARLALLAILLGSAALYLFRLDAVGYGNEYYAAAVRSMLESWHNFFFVSFDPGGFVTVDKPPAGFWIQVLSAKLLGFSGVSILLPEVLVSVASIALLYHLVRRAFGTVAGLLAALALALTPVAMVVARNNTIDSLLVCTLLLAVWAAFLATERGSVRWLVLATGVVGLGFAIKMLQAYLVVPAIFLLYLVAAPRRLLMRLAHLTLAGIVLVVVSLAWPVAVDLTPKDQRPYVGSTQDNSAIDLALGYNGVQRLLGMGGRQLSLFGLPLVGTRRGGPDGGGAPDGNVALGGAGIAGPNGNAFPGGNGFPDDGNAADPNGTPNGYGFRQGRARGQAGIGQGAPGAPGGQATGQGGPAAGGAPSGVAQGGAGPNAGAPGNQPPGAGPFPGGDGGGPGGGAAFGGPGGGPGGFGENGQPGALRLLNQQLAGQDSWLLPLALLGLVVSGYVAWRQRRTLSESRRAQAFILWGTWLASAAGFFSVAGFYHRYYLVMLGPPVAALAAIGVWGGWQAYRRDSRIVWLLPLGLLATAAVQAHILADYPEWSGRLTPIIIGCAAVAAIVLLGLRFGERLIHNPMRLTWATRVVAVVGTLALFIAPAAWGGWSVISGQTGGPVFAAGPAPRGGGFGFAGGPPPGFGGAAGGPQPGFGGPALGQNGSPGVPPGAMPNGDGAGSPPAGLAPGQQPNGAGGDAGGADDGRRAFGADGGRFGFNRAGDTGLIEYLQANRGSAKFLVATTNASSAAPIIITTGEPVMAMGGFTGSDPILTPEELRTQVEAGEVRFFLLGGPGGGPGGRGGGAAGWVQSACDTVTIPGNAGPGGQLYDCGSLQRAPA